MSYQDILPNNGAAPVASSSTGGRGATDNDNAKQKHSMLVASIFRINTCVSTFKRLVANLGTSKDNPQLREKLQQTEQDINKLVKEILSELKAASEVDHGADVSRVQKIADMKLAKDFDSVLKEFQSAQKRILEHKSSYVPPPVSNSKSGSSLPGELNLTVLGSRGEDQRPLLVEQRRQELLALESERVHNEAIIEEREEGIKEIQQQIGEVHEIFKDLAVLVHEQGILIDDIESNIENSQASTVQANTQLVKAARSQKSNSSLVCFLLILFGVVVMILIIVLAA